MENNNLEALVKEERLKYFQEWRNKNPNKVRRRNKNYWEKKAEEKLLEEENLMTQTTTPTKLTVREKTRTSILPEYALRLLLKAGKLPVIFIRKKAYINYEKLCDQFEQLYGSKKTWRTIWVLLSQKCVYVEAEEVHTLTDEAKSNYQEAYGFDEFPLLSSG